VKQLREKKLYCSAFVAMAVHQGINGKVIMPMAACVFVVLMQLLVMGKPVTCQETVVVISNEMPGEVLQLHCHSRDNDLGLQTLGYSSSYQFHFNTNIWGTTLFTCDFTSTHHPESVGIIVFQGPSYGFMPCEFHCNWVVTPNGFYLLGQFEKPWPQDTNTNVRTHT